MSRTRKTKTISLLLVISGIIVVFVGIDMVQTGFAGLENDEPTLGLYLGGIYSIIGGVLLIIGGIIYLNLATLKKKVLRKFAQVADAIEDERKKEDM